MRSTDMRSTSRPSLAAAVVSLFVAVSCEDEALVSFSVLSQPGRLDPGTVTVRFSDDGRTRTVSGNDFASHGQRADTPAFWRWNVSLFLDERNPHETCIGCFGYRSFPVLESYRTSPAESLWMTWGGNSISSPVVY